MRAYTPDSDSRSQFLAADRVPALSRRTHSLLPLPCEMARYESKISLLNLRTSTPFTPPMNDSAVAGLLYPQCETDEDCAYDGCSTYSMCLDPGLGAEVGNFCYQVYPESSFMCEDKSNGETIDAGQINWGVCYDGDRIDVCPVATCPEGCSYKAYNPFERNRVGRKLLFGSTPSSGCPAGCH